MTGEQLYNEFNRHRIAASPPGSLYIGAISGELSIAKAGVDEALQTINTIERFLEEK